MGGRGQGGRDGGRGGNGRGRGRLSAGMRPVTEAARIDITETCKTFQESSATGDCVAAYTAINTATNQHCICIH